MKKHLDIVDFLRGFSIFMNKLLQLYYSNIKYRHIRKENRNTINLKH